MEVKTEYQKKLLNPKWQQKRLFILNRDKWACHYCGDKEDTLHVHHLSYVKGREPWDYDDCNFQTLCESCHALVEFLKAYKNTSPIIAIQKFTSEKSVTLFTVHVNKSWNSFLFMDGVMEHILNFEKETFDMIIGFYKSHCK